MTEYNKLRWTTIGYHYDWTNKVKDLNKTGLINDQITNFKIDKVYNESDFTPVPEDVSKLSIHIASVLGWTSYQPEAGIINYYHMNSTLSAHQDFSEKNMSAPLISISLGSSAIFLIGDVSKHTRAPRPILLRSGDIVIMSGESRLAFHAVPKILPDPRLNQYFTYEFNDTESKFFVSDQEWKDFYDYIRINRINLNIRQVN